MIDDFPESSAPTSNQLPIEAEKVEEAITQYVQDLTQGKDNPLEKLHERLCDAMFVSKFGVSPGIASMIGIALIGFNVLNSSTQKISDMIFQTFLPHVQRNAQNESIVENGISLFSVEKINEFKSMESEFKNGNLTHLNCQRSTGIDVIEDRSQISTDEHLIRFSSVESERVETRVKEYDDRIDQMKREYNSKYGKLE